MPAQGARSEVWFYHLSTQPVAHALPAVLEKALERGWRVVVQLPDEEWLKTLDDALWTDRPDSFLPHGSDRDKNPEGQPILLTTGAACDTDGAAMRVYVGGAPVVLDLSTCPYERVVLMFDGENAGERADARRQWSKLKAAGFALTYWQQGAGGRWEKR